MLSSTAEYALRAVLYLAQQVPGTLVHVGEIAAALAIPRNYLSKILLELTRAGVLASSRGKHGGFRLGRLPEEISLFEVVTRFDRLAEQRSCLLGRPECSDRTPCAAHGRWKELSEQIARFFQETTVADLLRGAPLPV